MLEFNLCVAARKARATTEKFQACKALERMFELWPFVEGLNQIFAGEHAHVARIIDAELPCVRPFFTASLSESVGMVSEAIFDVRGSF